MFQTTELTECEAQEIAEAGTPCARAMRIRRTGYKVLYFVGCIAIYVVITNVILLPLLPAGPIRGSIQLVLGFLVVVGACQLFRGPGEDIVPPRPWAERGFLR